MSRTDVAATIRPLFAIGEVEADRPAAEARLAVLEAGGDFANGVIAHDGNRLGGQAFVSFDRQAVTRLQTAGVAARLA